MTKTQFKELILHELHKVNSKIHQFNNIKIKLYESK